MYLATPPQGEQIVQTMRVARDRRNLVEFGSYMQRSVVLVVCDVHVSPEGDQVFQHGYLRAADTHVSKSNI